LVEAQGGKISVHNREPRGFEVQICLPAKPPSKANKA
jgi:signal transduction histidine kinase